MDICHHIESHLTDYWVDYIDPPSGLPVSSFFFLFLLFVSSHSFFYVKKVHEEQSSSSYNEVQNCSSLLNMSTLPLGPCSLLVHPQWGTAVYPSSFFTTAPSDLLQDLLREQLNLQPIE